MTEERLRQSLGFVKCLSAYTDDLEALAPTLPRLDKALLYDGTTSKGQDDIALLLDLACDVRRDHTPCKDDTVPDEMVDTGKKM